MANYNTEFSTTLEIAEDTADWLERFLAGETIDGLGFLDCLERSDLQDMYDETWWGFDYHIYESQDKFYVNIDSGTDGNELCAIELIQVILEHEHSDAVIFFEAAFTCSKPVDDAFGGGCWAITREYVNSFDLWAWKKAEGENWKAFLEKEASSSGN